MGEQKGKMRILFIGANYSNDTVLRIPNEYQRIKEAIKPGKFRDIILLDECPAARRHDLPKYISEFRPTIIHFSGHGTGETGPLFEDDVETPEKLQDTLSVLRMYSDHLKLVFFNVCDSLPIAEETVKFIEMAIAAPHGVDDDGAIKAAEAFYHALANGDAIDICFTNAQRDFAAARGSGESHYSLLPFGSHEKVHRNCQELIEDTTTAMKPAQESNLQEASHLPQPPDIGQIVDIIKKNYPQLSHESMRVKLRASQLDNRQKIEIIEAILTDLDGLKSTSIAIIDYLSKFFPDAYEKFWKNQKNGDILFSILKDGPINEPWVKDIKANCWTLQPRDLKNALRTIFGFIDDLLDFVWEHFIEDHLKFTQGLNDNEKRILIWMGKIAFFTLPILLLIDAYVVANNAFIIGCWIYEAGTSFFYLLPSLSRYIYRRRIKNRIIKQEKKIAEFRKKHRFLYWLGVRPS